MGRDGRGGLTPPDELRALLLLRLLPGVGDRTTARLLRRWGSAKAVLALPDRELGEAGGEGAVRGRRDRTLLARVEDILERAEATGAAVVPIGDRRYPAALEHLTDPPPVLFCRGDLTLLGNRVVTVVGSRRSTAGGRRVAERMARSWSELGVTVASGMALGIDAAAHRGALGGAGRTIAVLGCGPDIVYPRANWPLFRRILEVGLIVSEFPPGEGAQPHHFPRRNRILAAIAQAVVVVEAARKSGALITVDHALDLGRDVFAVPGSVESPQSEGANALLLDGAHPLWSPERLLEVMEWGEMLGEANAPDAADVPGDEEGPTGRILGQLVQGPMSIEGLAAGTGSELPVLLASLSELELRGVVRRDGGSWIRVGR